STRGVPGTHDIALMQSVIDDLKAGKNTEVPHFDKAEDDRGGFTPVVSRDLSLLIIEGWCWGAMPAEGDELDHPMNALEHEDDEDGRWRRYVDRQLAHGGYQEVFAEAHTCLFLSVPDMEAVIRWRWQQEQRLAETRSDGTRIMTEPEVRRFIMYYERITRRMLQKMPERANMTLYLDNQHRIGPPPRG
ncbi:MAG: kinase, partial [Pseudomonadota bacterium]